MGAAECLASCGSHVTSAASGSTTIAASAPLQPRWVASGNTVADELLKRNCALVKYLPGSYRSVDSAGNQATI